MPKTKKKLRDPGEKKQQHIIISIIVIKPTTNKTLDNCWNSLKFVCQGTSFFFARMQQPLIKIPGLWLHYETAVYLSYEYNIWFLGKFEATNSS